MAKKEVTHTLTLSRRQAMQAWQRVAEQRHPPREVAMLRPQQSRRSA